MDLRTPKLAGIRSWYPYYAGYSEEFVEDVLRSLRPPDGSVLLDPWNGSGTTCSVGVRMRTRPTGLDINPALVLVAKGRLLDPALGPSLLPLARDAVSHAEEIFGSTGENVEDPLSRWLTPRGAHRVRSLERSIFNLLISDDAADSGARAVPSKTSPLAAFMYVCMFVTLRETLQAFRGSNPTWVKQSVDSEDLVSSPWPSFRSRFLAAVLEQRSKLETALPTHRYEPVIDVADSRRLPLADSMVDLVVTSPPYLTRIDYAVATTPELAILGIGTAEELKALRGRMIGTPTVSKGETAQVGAAGESFLQQVEGHPSKASSTYYLKYFQQYLHGMAASLSELSRVSKPGAKCVLVVQDSYYKDVHCDLAKIVTDSATLAGFMPVRQVDFLAPRTMASINRESRKYRRTFTSTESVVFLERASSGVVS